MIDNDEAGRGRKGVKCLFFRNTKMKGWSAFSHIAATYKTRQTVKFKKRRAVHSKIQILKTQKGEQIIQNKPTGSPTAASRTVQT